VSTGKSGGTSGGTNPPDFYETDTDRSSIYIKTRSFVLTMGKKKEEEVAEDVIPFTVFSKMLSERVENYDNWFVIDPAGGDVWIVPVKDLGKIAFRSGCIIPHENGWWPEYDDMGKYIWCTSTNGITTTLPQVMVNGTFVERGPSWKWKDQDASGIGIVVETSERDFGEWISVQWKDDSRNGYRWAYSILGYGIYDVRVVIPTKADLTLLAPYKKVRII
jgi:hypothetical protein